LKILVFSPYYPPHIGGLENHADEFNYHLARLGYEISVFTPRIPIDAKEIENRYKNVKVFRFPAFEIIPNYPLPKLWSLRFWQLFMTLFQQKFDVVISRTRFFVTTPMAFLFSKLKNTKWMHIEHGSDFVRLSSQFSTLLARIYDETLGRLMISSSDINVSISQAVQSFIKRFDKRASPLIYRGINFGFINKVKPRIYFRRKYKGKILLSFSGRLYKWKGVENTIKAIKGMSEPLKRRIIFIIMGDGEDLDRLKNIADNYVLFTGKITRQEVISFLKISDVYIHSSFSGGGLSTSLLEAIYCGCRIVATPGEGAKEILNDNNFGILIKESSSAAIKAGIVDMCENIKELSSSKDQQKFVEANFNWQNSIDKYNLLIKTLV